MNIYLDIDNRRCQTALGEQAFGSEIPLFAYSTLVPVLLYLRDASGQAVTGKLVAGDTATVRIDNTASETDTPCVLANSADVTIDTTAQTLAFSADCLTVKFQTAITGQSAKVAAWIGVKVYASGATQPKLAIRAPVYLDNIVYDEGATPPAPVGDYYTKAQADSLLSGKAASHTNRTDIGRALVDGDNLFVGLGLLAACSRLYTYIAAKLAAAYGLLTTAQKTTLTGGNDADSLHTHAYTSADRATAPAGTTVLGTVYRNNAGTWEAADPDAAANETCELWIAQGTDSATHGMLAAGVLTNPAWSWTTIGAVLWLDDAGAITETTPDAVTDAGRVARPVGWVRSATSIRFDGHLLGSSFEEIGS